MPRRDRLQETLTSLGRVRQDPAAEASLAELRRVLAREPSPAARKAAAIAGEAGLAVLVPDLRAAFFRFLEGPAANDRGCAAKAAVVEAFLRLEHDDDEVFRRGIRHVQMEPVFGGRVDTAGDLRGASALGLARSPARDVLLELARLLADPEPPARVAAARAIGSHGREAGLPLLRYKSLAGDEEPWVVTECLLALLRLDPRGSLSFVAGFLEGQDAPGPAASPERPRADRAECAATALGESRLPEAFPVLREWYANAAAARRPRVALLALAALRRDESLGFLLSLVREAEPGPAAEAAQVLAGVAGDGAFPAKVREAASGRPDVLEAYERARAVEGR